MELEAVYFAKLHDDAVIPKRGTEESAGFDLYALEDTLIIGGAGNVLVPTGIAVKLPKGTYGRIAMRSGLALKQHLTVSAGVIDRDYSGPIGLLVSSTKVFDTEHLKEYVLKEDCEDLSVYYLKRKYIKGEIHSDNNSLYVNEKKVHPVLTPHAYLIKKGERFAQLIIERVCYAPCFEVSSIESTNHLGFGSTNKY